MAKQDSYTEFAKRICAGNEGLLESVMSTYRHIIMEDAVQTAPPTAATGSTPSADIPDVVLNTNKLTTNSANVIATKLIDLANQEEKLAQSKKDLQNLSGAASSGG